MIGGATIGSTPIGSALALDEEAYQLWLRDPKAKVIHLIEINYHGDSAVYPNWATYTLKLCDTYFPPYKDIIKSLPSFTRQIGEDFTGDVSTSIGTLDLYNLSGSLDLWHNLSMDGQRCRIFHGGYDYDIDSEFVQALRITETGDIRITEAGDYRVALKAQSKLVPWERNRFRLTNECIVEIVSSGAPDTLSIRLRSVDYESNLPIQTTLIAAGPNAGKQRPLSFDSVFNVSPMLDDVATSLYVWHGAVDAGVSDVRDDGIAFETSTKTISAVDAGTNTLTTSAAHGFVQHTRVNFGAGTPPAPLALDVDYWVIATGLTTTNFRLALSYGGSEINITGTDTGASCVGFHWTTLGNGDVILDSAPSGQLTLDGTGYQDEMGDLLALILDTTNTDYVSKTIFNETCQQTIGIYVEDRANRLALAKDLASGLGAWFGHGRYGLLRFGRIEASYTSHDYELGADDMIEDSFRLEKMIPPRKQNRMQYKNNWTNQTGNLAAGVSEENRAIYSEDYSVTTPTLGADEGADGSEYHKLAVIPEAKPSFLQVLADADAEAARLDTLYYGWGAVFSCEVGRVGTEIDIGNIVKVTHPRYGCSAGVRMPCVYIEEKDTVRLKFFAALAAYAPGQL